MINTSVLSEKKTTFSAGVSAAYYYYLQCIFSEDLAVQGAFKHTELKQMEKKVYLTVTKICHKNLIFQVWYDFYGNAKHLWTWL